MFDGISTAVLLLYVILLLLALIVLTLLVLLVQSGIFTSVDEVKTGKPPVGQMILAYKFNRGPYNQAGQLFTEAAIIEPGNKKVGIYYDDPNKVESSKLRYVVGSILSVGSDQVNTDMVKKFTDNGFKIIHLPEVTYGVYTRFPHITTLSILIAVHKAYPKLQAYIEERKLCAYPFLEYYDGGHIHFWAPLSRQEEFFVPECETAAGGDQPTTEWDSTAHSNSSQSCDDDLQVSHDLPHSPVEEKSEKPVSESADESTNWPISGTDNQNSNNTNVETVEAKEDDQGSDDSSSSFELLKPELGTPTAE
ncbi:testis-expressed sequence 264 protein [Biomphalaria pfeifferi]|uniref:Testis-expressed sequence 264 protein n=1 Tax=Biomphalaria pfeifferi TaxID=112525 RepID=A0AAD8BC05_BIOPF|nr:testis-expressed sequence 264 protein [Biomphalaria pfeifferi]